MLNLENVKIYSSAKNDVKDAIDLIGAKVYMSDYEDFYPYSERKLIGVSYTKDGSILEEYPYMGRNEKSITAYRYFVLTKDVKEVK